MADILVNSSDIEPDDVVDESDLGLKLINKFMMSIQTDRVASIKFQKGLKLSHLAPATNAEHQRSWNQFSYFYQNAGARKMTDTPRMRDVERFLERAAAHTKGRSPDGLQRPSADWFRHLIRSVLTNCTFYFADFKFTKHDRIRLNSLTNTLIKTDVLSTDATKERQWVGVLVVRLIATRFIHYAINEGGVRNWDVAWSKIASLVLQSALASRCGDILRAAKYGNHYCLEWKHINIRFSAKPGAGTSFADLVMVIDLQFEKHDKDKKKVSRKVLFEPLPPNADNILCPIKVLLVQALRCKYLLHDTLEECLESLRARKGGPQLQFRPEAYDRPVFPAFFKGGSRLVLDQPAGHEQITKTLRELGEIAGITTLLSSHDNRRGAARELALLPKSQIDVATATAFAAKHIGHDPKTQAEGTTQDYIGHSYTNEYTRRVENALNPEHFDHLQSTFGVEVASEGFRKRKVDTKEVDEEILRSGRDLGNSVHRQQAAKKLKNDQREGWKSEQQIKGNIRPALLAKSTNTMIQPAAQAKITKIDEEALFLANLDPQLHPPPMTDEELHKTAFEGEVDPAGIAALADTEDADVAMLGGDANAFIMAFATFNVVTRSDKGLVKEGETAFAIKCKNHVHGCEYSAPKQSTVNSHELKCKTTSPGLALSAKPIACKAVDCDRRYDTKEKMEDHYKKVHGWVAKQCNFPGCTEKKFFQARGTYDVHKRTHKVNAPTWEPRRCAFPGCTKEMVYAKKNSLRAHLEQAHHLVREQLAPFIK
ncbi:hypothetical protein BKA64DRAFT_755535 [Cadophora sp. MPI-SDFR-AT-0126]|nr:hypothetical protein BKA64DRAFT_755535 [Leotiomycetes sp. MPI-SDFR-AT-0126]